MVIEPKEAVSNVIADWITEAGVDWWPGTDRVAQQVVDAIPDGWAKVGGEWVCLKYGNWTTFARDTDGNGYYLPKKVAPEEVV